MLATIMKIYTWVTTNKKKVLAIAIAVLTCYGTLAPLLGLPGVETVSSLLTELQKLAG